MWLQLSRNYNLAIVRIFNKSNKLINFDKFTPQFFGPQQNSSEHKAKRLEKFERMRRAKSMPKMDGEEEVSLQTFA